MSFSCDLVRPLSESEKIDSDKNIKNIRELTHSFCYSNTYKNSYFSTFSNNRNKRLAIKQYAEGFTSFFEKTKHDLERSYGSCWMSDSGRTIGVCNDEERPSLAELSDSNSASRRKFKRKVRKLWTELFQLDDDLIFETENYSIISRLSKNIFELSTREFRNEVYYPVAFVKNGDPIGGAYLHIWQSGISEQLKLPRAPLNEAPIKEFYTGGCLFGSSLYGIDQNGYKHSLTSPHYEIDDDVFIQSIECPFSGHPDELLTMQSLVNKVPLMKALGHEKNIILRFHLPLSNYILYGLNWFLLGKMSHDAFVEYTNIVKARAIAQTAILKQFGEKHDINLNISTSIDNLGLSEGSAKTLVSDLFIKLGLEGSYDMDGFNNIGSDTYSLVVNKIWAFLINQNSDVGEVWRHGFEKMHLGEIDLDHSNLLTINFMDYSANLALAARQHSDREVASLLPSHEGPVSHWYKKVFAEKYGPVLCIQWLSPIQINIADFRDRVFYLEHYVKELSMLMDKEVPYLSYLQTASVALDSVEMAGNIALELHEIFSEHEAQLYEQENITTI